MLTRRRVLIGGSAAVLTACSAPQVWAPEAAVQRAFAPQVGDPSLTLYTMKNTSSDNGAHTGLLINASQRVMFDPAGTFALNVLPERNDVIFGMTPRMEAAYASFHARETYYVIAQRIPVPATTAEQALQLALTNGPVPKAACTRATSTLMQKLPGFGTLRRTFFPNNLHDAIAKRADVQTTIYRENDADDKRIAAEQLNTAIQAAPLE